MVMCIKQTKSRQNAGVAELADAPALGAGGRNPVQVQFLSPAVIFQIYSEFRALTYRSKIIKIS